MYEPITLTHNQEKNDSRKTDPEITDKLEFAHEDFKTAIINMSDLKKIGT